MTFKAQMLNYLLDYLTDENIGKLICCIYSKKQFINPYKTNKEMFINILFDNLDHLNHFLFDDFEYIYSMIVGHKKTLEAMFAKGEINSFSDNVNIYTIIWRACIKYKFNKFKLEEISYENSIKITEDMLIAMVKFYYSIALPIDNYNKNNNPFREYIFKIVDAINSFNIQFKDRYLGNYKNLLNMIIKRIIDTRKFYQFSYEVDKKNKNILFYLSLLEFPPITDNTAKINVERKFKLIEKQEGLYIKGVIDDFEIKGINSVLNKKGSSKPLVGSSVTESFERKLNCLDDAIKKYDGKITKCQMCHREHLGTQRCKECSEIIDIILNENISTLKNRKIVEYRIERKKTMGMFDSIEESKEFRYKNLKELLKNVNISDLKTRKRLEELINITFGDIDSFKF